MGEAIVKDFTPSIAGNQPVTPAKDDKNQTEDPAAELARLRKENEESKSRLAEKDKTINDLSTEKSTLESRLSMTQAVDSVVDQRGESAEPEKPKGGQDVRGYVRTEELPVIIDNNTFINKMKEDNKDMMEFGLEPVITLKADQLIRQGKTFKEAVATAVKEQREKFDKLKQPAKAADPAPAAGVRGEDGAPASPEPKPAKVESMEDEGDARRLLRQKRGL